MKDTRPWPILDGHNDTLLQLYRPRKGQERSFFTRSERGHIDLSRAQEGHFGGGFFSVFVPPHPSTPSRPLGTIVTNLGYELPPFPELDYGYALETALAMMALLFRLEAESDGQLKVVRTTSELKRCLNKGVIAAILHFKGADAIGTNLNELEVFYKAGLRSLGPVWSRPNRFAHGVPFKFPHSPDTGPGLTDAGCELIKACNQMGILIDLSHLNEKGFWEVAELSSAPLVVSHAAAHTLCPSTRNLTNTQLDAIAKSGGLVGINFNVRDLRPDGKTDPNTPLIETVRHINFISHRIGIEHVAFGSDFDGATVCNELKDVTGLPRLIATLEETGYDRTDLRKLTHQNWLRVLKQTWKS